MRGLFAFIVAAAIAAVSAWLFSFVVPWAAAIVLGIVLGIVELVGAQRGQSVRALLRIDALVLAWPGAAFLLWLSGVADRGLRISIAAGLAAVLAGLAAGRGSGDDDARMRVAILSVLIVGYSLLRTFVQPMWNLWALAAASAAAAVPLLVVSGGGVVLPAGHKAVLRAAALLCIVAAIGEGAMALVAR